MIPSICGIFYTLEIRKQDSDGSECQSSGLGSIYFHLRGPLSKPRLPSSLLLRNDHRGHPHTLVMSVVDTNEEHSGSGARNTYCSHAHGSNCNLFSGSFQLCQRSHNLPCSCAAERMSQSTTRLVSYDARRRRGEDAVSYRRPTHIAPPRGFTRLGSSPSFCTQ
jgi:hypothetical protein